ncbi:MAG: phage terminase large subunit [Rhodospirillaceae bacterium]|nr:phage terminase large subunit [Rhodospirillaceae bacterium]
MSNRQKAVDAILRRDFLSFVAKVQSELDPNGTFIEAPHIQALTYALTRVARGELTRLIANLPPRHLKSICMSVALPAWILGHDPSRRMICVSYGDELSRKHANDFRQVFGSPWYQRVFPRTRVNPRKNTETEVTTTAKGFRYTTSIGGALTGRGADLIIIDDPIKAGEVGSDLERNKTNEWFSSTLFSRLDNKKTGAILVGMQRLHEHDLTGYLLERGGFDHLMIPAIATEACSIPTGPDTVFTRQPGDVLCEERESRETLEEIRRNLGSHLFAAQYQQKPVPAEGNFFKASSLKTYDRPPAPNEIVQIVQSWDPAMTENSTSDYSVCTTWAICNKGNKHLLNVLRGRWEYPTLCAQVLTAAQEYRPHAIIIEDVGCGKNLLQSVRQHPHFNFVAFKPEGDKKMRAIQQTVVFESGRVLFPKEAPWLADLTHELLAFPSGRHDDQVDSVVQFLAWAAKHYDSVVMDVVIPNMWCPSRWDPMR